MMEIVPGALAAWVALSAVLFWRLPGRDAVPIALIGGWAFLPVALYPRSAFGEPAGMIGYMHALAIPTAVVVNKALAIGLGCLAGSLLFGWPALKRVRLSRLDLPIAVWCLTPVAATAANGLPIAEGLAQARYLVLAWGVPYLMGRAYLGDNDALRRFGLAWVLAGLAYAPFCVVEFLAGPFLYMTTYGPHPYQLDGAARPVLFRPMGWLEHGNQLGMWVATSAVASVWLWRSKGTPEVGREIGPIAAGLSAVCLACQSLGGILLWAAVVVPLSAASQRSRAVRAGVIVGVVLLGALAVSAASVGVMGGRARVREAFQATGKGSFTWRLARYEEHLRTVARRPVLGRARSDWSAAPDGTFVCPVALGLWLPALGMYGVVGLAAMTLVLILPVVEVVKWLPLRSWLNPGCAGVTLAAVLLSVNVADAIWNSGFLLPLLAAAGGVNSWSLGRYEGR